MKLVDVTHEKFSDVVGDPFAIEAEGVSAVELVSVTLKPSLAGGKANPFVLTFHGPADTLLPQKIYKLEHEKLGRLEIFLVPVDQDESHVYYEAVFN